MPKSQVNWTDPRLWRKRQVQYSADRESHPEIKGTIDDLNTLWKLAFCADEEAQLEILRKKVKKEHKS